MNGNKNPIQWFPGHMAKTLRLIESEINNVDAVIEILDARIPYSSRNREFCKIVNRKPTLILLNKSDLAEPEVTKDWIKYYKDLGSSALCVVSKERRIRAEVAGALENAVRPVTDAKAKRGMDGFKVRAMVIGIPNVGKSTFINTMALSAPTKVADKPGVTRGKQWIDAGKVELLDMPGTLWPKFESSTVANHLAFCGAINDSIMDMTELAVSLIAELRQGGREEIMARYSVEYTHEDTELMILEMIAKKRGMLLAKGRTDVDRAAIMLIDELRAGKLGRISFERVRDGACL